jgi:Putative Ig domain
MKRLNTAVLLTIVCGLLVLGSGCGGGSSTPTAPPPAPPPPPAFTITTTSLPDALQAHPYTATLAAANANGAVKWSIGPVAGQTFTTGLAIDANSGVLSGTANWSLIGALAVQATDAAGRVASKTLQIVADPPLTAGPSTTTQVTAYFDVSGLTLNVAGGVPPVRFRVISGTTPPGLHIQSNGTFSGAPYQLGSYSATVEARDSYSPAEVITQQVTIKVAPPGLSLGNTVGGRLPLNTAYSDRLVALGGVAPYTYSVLSGALPPGLTLVDPATGQVSGIPTQAGSFSVQMQATDSSTPPQTATNFYFFTIDAPRGRNDTPATATVIPDNTSVLASFSPYIDPADKAPTVADGDYYKLSSAAGKIITFNTHEQSALVDTVLEIVDANGIRFNTCRPVGNIAAPLTSPCINDDVIPNDTNSALQFEVPGAAGATTTYYAHVLDWRGSARPDMTYTMDVQEFIPLAITTTSAHSGTVGAPYFQDISTVGGQFPLLVTFVGSLPPGIAFNGLSFSGTPTTVGNFPFTLQVKDSSNPPQTASVSLTIAIFAPVKITSPATLPDACVNQPYSFQVTTSGGAPPLQFDLTAFPFVINLSSGLITGTATQTGIFTGSLGVVDASPNRVTQPVTVTIKTCP